MKTFKHFYIAQGRKDIAMKKTGTLFLAALLLAGGMLTADAAPARRPGKNALFPCAERPPRSIHAKPEQRAR